MTIVGIFNIVCAWLVPAIQHIRWLKQDLYSEKSDVSNKASDAEEAPHYLGKKYTDSDSDEDGEKLIDETKSIDMYEREEDGQF